MSILQDLLKAFPEYWQTGHESVPVLILRYDGPSCWVKIEDDVMEVIPSDSPRVIYQLDQLYADPITHAPTLLKLGQLATALGQIPRMHVELVEESFPYFSDATLNVSDLDNIWRTFPGIWTSYPLPGSLQTAQDLNADDILDTEGWYLNQPGTTRPIMVPGVSRSIGNLAAVILTDTNQNLNQNTIFGAPTNLLWPLLKPMARVLRHSQEYGDGLVSQMDLRNVAGPWLDRWGEVYGAFRIPPEDDSSFKKRLAATTFKPRLSTTSMEKALIEGFGLIDATVSDTAVHQFLVKLRAKPEQGNFFGRPSKDLIDLYRAAGTIFSQQGTMVPEVENIPLFNQTIRMKQQRTITGGTSTLAFTSIEDGPWIIDVANSTLSLETPGLFGGRMMGDVTFG